MECLNRRSSALSHEFLYGCPGEIRKARIKNLLALLGLVEERFVGGRKSEPRTAKEFSRRQSNPRKDRNNSSNNASGDRQDRSGSPQNSRDQQSQIQRCG